MSSIFFFFNLTSNVCCLFFLSIILYVVRKIQFLTKYFFLTKIYKSQCHSGQSSQFLVNFHFYFAFFHTFLKIHFFLKFTFIKINVLTSIICQSIKMFGISSTFFITFFIKSIVYKILLFYKHFQVYKIKKFSIF